MKLSIKLKKPSPATSAPVAETAPVTKEPAPVTKIVEKRAAPSVTPATLAKALKLSTAMKTEEYKKQEAAAKAKVVEEEAIASAKEKQENYDQYTKEVAVPKLKLQLKLAKKEEEIKEASQVQLPEVAIKALAKSNPELAASSSIQKLETKQLNKDQVTYEDLNSKQKEAVDFALNGLSMCLIGSAGTGKTTTQRVITSTLSDSGAIYPLTSSSKHFSINMPSILITSFTNKAVENIRSAVPNEFKNNCMTIHKALEYAPVWYEEEDEETGLLKKKMKFEPARNAENPLPAISVCVIEEASTIGTGLFAKLVEALPKDCIFIFLGDLQQLPPVMDDAILGFALNYLPIVELTEVYRQALESPIINFAYKILEGKPLKATAIEKLQEGYDPTQLKFVPFKKWEDPEEAIKKIGLAFQAQAESEKLDVDNSVVLLPFNTGGNINVFNINRYIAQGITNRTGNVIHEVIAGFKRYYYSEGDILFANKTLMRIKSIKLNYEYKGVTPNLSTSLDRWGHIAAGQENSTDSILDETFDFDEAMEIAAAQAEASNAAEDEERKQAASHIISLVPLNFYEWDEFERDNYIPIELRTASEINEAQFGYALTVHKSQGSEWKNVYCIFADEHSRMLQRELLYTAVTRARQKLVVFYQPEGRKLSRNGKSVRMDCVFEKGIKNQQIPGSTLESKLKYFKSKEDEVVRSCTLRARGELREIGLNFRENEKEYQVVIDRLWNEHPIQQGINLFKSLVEKNSEVH